MQKSLGSAAACLTVREWVGATFCARVPFRRLPFLPLLDSVVNAVSVFDSSLSFKPNGLVIHCRKGWGVRTVTGEIALPSQSNCWIADRSSYYACHVHVHPAFVPSFVTHGIYGINIKSRSIVRTRCVRPMLSVISRLLFDYPLLFRHQSFAHHHPSLGFPCCVCFSLS